MQSYGQILVGQSKNVQFLAPITYTIHGVEMWGKLGLRKENNVAYPVPDKPGVYEVWYGEVNVGDSICLRIGSGKNLFKRVHSELIGGKVENDLDGSEKRGKGKQSHSYRLKILEYAKNAQSQKYLWVRWSLCEAYNLVEVYLHQLYQPVFPDEKLLEKPESWNLDLSMKGEPWGKVYPWLRAKGYQI